VRDLAWSRLRVVLLNRLIASAAIVLLAGCGGISVRTRLSISVDDGRLGFYEFSLRCNPASGTVPDPSVVCAELNRRPELVTTQPGRWHSCPTSFGVRINGLLSGKEVSTTLSPCSGGTERVADDWEKMLRLPDFALQLESGRSFTDRLVISSRKDGLTLRYSQGARFAIAFPLKNVSSAPLTITSVSGPQWPTTDDPYRPPKAPQLLRLIGVRLTGLRAASSGGHVARPALAPVKSGPPAPYTLQSGATVVVQENFVIGGCSAFKPGTVHSYNKRVRVWVRGTRGSIGGWSLALPGYRITITAPSPCPR
jgi:hypothetical protein